MATTKDLLLHENVIDGVETTLPAHLIGNKWRTQHNMRLTPSLEQVPHKVLYDTFGSRDIRWMGTLPGQLPGFGKLVVMSDTTMYDKYGATIASLTGSTAYLRWATQIYDSGLFYTNELNTLRSYNGSSHTVLSTSPSGRYLTVWYDHMVVGHPTFAGIKYPNRVMISDLFRFDSWIPTATNEADYYDFVEWQQTDYPFSGVTGIGKLNGTLWVYTPTAIVPLVYVGLPKVFQVQEAGVITRTGNTYPWTLVCLNNVHFFFDGVEKTFFANTGGEVKEIGEPVRKYLQNNLSNDASLAAKMYGYVDVDNREIWWNFVSQSSAGAFDKAVVFNYRYMRWFTASVEDVQSFCGGVELSNPVSSLPGIVGDLTGTVANLGTNGPNSPRSFGGPAGTILREELTTDAASVLLAQDDPTLETGDYHYGNIRLVKENDGMVLNAAWDPVVAPDASIAVSAKGRDYLGEDVDWTEPATQCGAWTPEKEDAELNGYTTVFGRVMRYLFVGKNMRGLKFHAFCDRIRKKDNEA